MTANVSLSAAIRGRLEQVVDAVHEYLKAGDVDFAKVVLETKLHRLSTVAVITSIREEVG